MERILEQVPRFFSPENIGFLLQAAGLTLGMTVVGCTIGFGLAFVLVYLRQTPGLWALPLRVICIAYVEIFRRIPFLVVMLYEAHRSGCSIGEVPIIFVERRVGQSKMSGGVIFESAYMPWRVVLRRGLRRHTVPKG